MLFNDPIVESKRISETFFNYLVVGSQPSFLSYKIKKKKKKLVGFNTIQKRFGPPIKVKIIIIFRVH